MIARIAGRLQETTDGSAVIDCGAGLWYEVLIPACDATRLARKLGSDVVLHTLHFMEGDPSHGAITPRLIGFASEADREFFKVFTTVKGIGVRKALRALVRPAAEISAAIQAKDAKLLITLPGIGKRAAETIVAELHGKVEKFAGELTLTSETELPDAATEAIAVLIQLGEKRPDATALIERVMAVAPELDSPEEILQKAYKLRGGA